MFKIMNCHDEAISNDKFAESITFSERPSIMVVITILVGRNSDNKSLSKLPS
ncbi:hypothetical protein CSP5_1265 [Cuniculiplasma divulgatum]|uniref:Uncharacterized protein n=1 Tax=Cuniculiplasma divulgatum TaxID=1673428 RepID=A0A1N5V848_9ARCH|nr:MAG: hypothetical protein AMDU5_GPLC00003G0204 [Thermoplasmatales archaeon Gpl]SIM68956.1 hypothetical protein CSP5_1265 [Cuniculiplasma divulgatum]